MDQTALTTFRTYLSEEKQRFSQQAGELTDKQCTDEAILAKVRLNIVSIFETLLETDARFAADPADLNERFSARFSTIPLSWKNRLMQAKAHNDLQTQAIEEAKLETADRIFTVFQSAKEHAHD